MNRLQHFRSAPTSAPPFDLRLGLGRVIKVIDVPTLEHDADPVTIENVKAVASYNWIESSTPTIVVPGSPAIWQEPKLPIAVPRDSGTVIIDQNGHRMPNAVLSPLIKAIQHIDPTFDFPSIDIVTDRNSLRKLFRWVKGSQFNIHGGLVKPKNFRIDVEVAGSGTVLFVGRDGKTQEEAGKGYGLGFEKMFSKPAPGCEEFVGHCRIITYDFGNLQLLVRYEVDACLSTSDSPKMEKVEKSLDDIIAAFSSLSVEKKSPGHEATSEIPSAKPTFTSTTTPGPASSLKVIPGGTLIPQEHTIELTTCSDKYISTFDWAENFTQLYLSQTEHHFLGRHNFGKFISITKRKLHTPETEALGRKYKKSLEMLAVVLARIHALVVSEGGKMSLVCEDGVLKLYVRNDDKTALSPELKAVFD